MLSSSLLTNEAATTIMSEFAKSWPTPYNGSCLTVGRVLNKNSKRMKNCRKIPPSTTFLSLISLQPCISLPPTLISIYHFYNKWISQFITHPRCIGNWQEIFTTSRSKLCRAMRNMLRPVRWASMSTTAPILYSTLSTLQGSTFITYSTYWSICLQNLSKLLMGWKRCFVLLNYREVYLARINYAHRIIGLRLLHNFSKKSKNTISGDILPLTIKTIIHSSRTGTNSSKWIQFCLGIPKLRSLINKNLNINFINNLSILPRKQLSRQLKAVFALKIMKSVWSKESSAMDLFLFHSLRTIPYPIVRVRMVN